MDERRLENERNFSNVMHGLQLKNQFSSFFRNHTLSKLIWHVHYFSFNTVITPEMPISVILEKSNICSK